MDTHGDNRLLLRPSVAGTLGLLLICCALVALGVWLASEGETIGWVATCFFGLGILVAVVQLLPNASYLLLTDSGFEARAMYRSWSRAIASKHQRHYSTRVLTSSRGRRRMLRTSQQSTEVTDAFLFTQGTFYTALWQTYRSAHRPQ